MKKKQAKKEIKRLTKFYGVKTTAKILKAIRIVPVKDSMQMEPEA